MNGLEKYAHNGEVRELKPHYVEGVKTRGGPTSRLSHFTDSDNRRYVPKTRAGVVCLSDNTFWSRYQEDNGLIC